MPFVIDRSLHWSDHYVEHGFCVIKGAVDKAFCRRGIEAYRKFLGTDLEPRQWSTQTLPHVPPGGRVIVSDPALRAFVHTVYDEPGFRAAVDTMLGSPQRWSGERGAMPFLTVYDPANQRQLKEWGHVDFVRVRIPIIGSGFVFQVSLIDSEPFSGNITVYPGWHRVLQKKLLEDDNYWYADDGPEQEAWRRLVPKVEPFEFVAEAGDLLFMHHLVGHASNLNAAANRTPRVAIHGGVNCKDWPNEIDPSRPGLSPWERSLALNGPIKLGYDERAVQTAAMRAKQEERPAAAAAGAAARPGY